MKIKISKTYLSFLIIFLLIFLVVFPVINGNKIENMKTEFLDDYSFDRYYKSHDFNISNCKEELYIKCYENKIENIYSKRTDESIPLMYSDGLMDSCWPMKCQNLRHTGRSPYSTVDNNGAEKWRYKTYGKIDGGSIIDNERAVYFGDSAWYFYALNSDGSLKWQFMTDGRIWSTPALAEDGTIYIGSYDTRLYAFNPDGSLKWYFGSGGSISSSPAIGNDGTIYFGTMGFPSSDGCKIIALYPNGIKKWEYQTGYKIVSDPAIGDDGTIYIGSGDGYLYAMNPDGTLKWRYSTGDYVKSHPVIADDGTIYFDSFDGYLYALNPNGTLKWRTSGGDHYAASVALAGDGTIYDPGDQYLYAINPDGTSKWSFFLDSDMFIGHASPAVSADGTIYVGARRYDLDGGFIIAINPDGSELWRKKIGSYSVSSSPCIGEDGTVYIGSTFMHVSSGNFYGYFYAFGRNEVNNPPEKPTIRGTIFGKIGNEYQYRLMTTDPELDDVYYYVDWGDDSNSSWIGPYSSSEEITLSHIWMEKGTYTISAKAKDSYDGSESDWSTLTIIMPKNMNIIDSLFYSFIQNHLLIKEIMLN